MACRQGHPVSARGADCPAAAIWGLSRQHRYLHACPYLACDGAASGSSPNLESPEPAQGTRDADRRTFSRRQDGYHFATERPEHYRVVQDRGLLAQGQGASRDTAGFVAASGSSTWWAAVDAGHWST